jgi:hypothetical protein
MDVLATVVLFAVVKKQNRARLAEQLLPVALPGSTSQRLAIAAITAEQQLERQARTEQSIVEDAISAAHFENVDALAEFPALQAAFRRLPAARQAVLFPASTGGPGDGDADPTLRRKARAGEPSAAPPNRRSAPAGPAVT